MSAMSESITEIVRRNVTERMGAHVCRACDQVHVPESALSIREVARQSGVPFNTVARFLRGRTVSSDTLDRLDAWTR